MQVIVRRKVSGSGQNAAEGYLRKVVGAVPKQHVDHGETSEVVADRTLLGHADAAVQLHGLLSDEFSGTADKELSRRDGLTPL